MSQLKKATNIKEIYQQFDNEKPLEIEDIEFYIDIYCEVIKDLRVELELNDNYSKTLYISGQSGSGKSTALNFLINDEIKDDYIVKYIRGINLLYPNNISIMDILLMTGFELIKDDEDLKKEYFEKLNQLNKNELIENLNKIFIKYREKNENKKFLIIFDDLEKIEIKEQIKSIFIDNKYVFDKLNCVKILTIPIYLIIKWHFEDNLFRFTINPIDDYKELDGESHKNRELLKKLVKIKLKNRNLINQEALNKAIYYSAGNIRNLIMIIKKSAFTAYKKSETIKIEHITKSISYLKKHFSLSSSKIRMLKYIVDNNIQALDMNMEDDYIDLINDNTIFLYFNGTPRVEINPIIKDSVEKYIQTNNFINSINLPHKFNYLNSISIKNYFSIENLKLTDLKDKKEIYFVGENGDGKTILLQAILLALKHNNINSVLAKSYIKDVENEMELEILDKEPYINNSIFAYGINRNKISEDEFDEDGYSGLFDTPSLKNTTLFKRPEYLLKKNSDIVKEFIPKLENILENSLKIEVKNDKVTFIENYLKEIEFKLLSEGYKTTIIWLCDLLDRLIENQQNITKLEDFKAIVLIDEIDLYLHPKWKYDFVHKLRDIFKNIQFIITTHSLVTILGANKDAVFYKVYKKDGITKIAEEVNDISNYTANILLSSPLFGLKTIQTRDYKGSDNISSDDYKQNEINQQIKKKLENNENEISNDMKQKILNELDL